MEATLSFILQSIIAVGFAAIAYFVKKLIEDNEKQHGSSKKSIKAITAKIEGIERTVNQLNRAVSDNEGGTEFHFSPRDRETLEKIKRKVSSAIIGTAEVQKTITEKILPEIELQQENYGKVIRLKDRVTTQDKKIKTLYTVVSKLIVKSQKH